MAKKQKKQVPNKPKVPPPAEKQKLTQTEEIMRDPQGNMLKVVEVFQNLEDQLRETKKITISLLQEVIRNGN